MYLKTFFSASLLIFSATALALPTDDEMGTPQSHKLEWISKELQLTPDQASKVDVVLKEQHAKFKAIHEESSTRIEAILTPEQITKWEKIKAERQEKRKEWRKHLK